MFTQTLENISIRRMLLALSFTFLAITIPSILHQLIGPSAGKMLLPMQLFVFTAGLVLGWKEGMVVGILSALTSHSLTGMPDASVLPIITGELAIYGFFCGYLHKTKKWNVLFSVLGAIFIGRIVLWITLTAIHSDINASLYLLSALKSGWPGIISQIVFLPFINKIIPFLTKNEEL